MTLPPGSSVCSRQSLPIRQRKLALAVLVALGSGMLAGCSGTGTLSTYDPSRAHHRPGGFVNVYGPTGGKSLAQVLRWRWQAWRQALPPAPTEGYESIKVVEPDFERLASPSTTAPTITWMGHATVLLQVNGVNILTDPIFSDRASPVRWAGPKRKRPLPASLAQLPRIDLVVISHNHADHLDEPTIRELVNQQGGQPQFLVPLGVDALLKEFGVTKTQPMDWWDRYEVGELRMTFVPAQHWSARGLSDRNKTLWGGWVIEGAGKSVYFAGDTGYSRHFAEIGARFGGFDLALIPIGAYEPRWFMKDQHVNPDEAARIHIDVRSRLSVGVHWGSFELTDEALDKPRTDLATARQKYGIGDEQFIVLDIGQTLEVNE